MGEVTIEFKGICTHFRRETTADLPVPHRVVLVTANTWTTISDVRIPPHLAKMNILTPTSTHPEGEEFVLQGVRLSIEGGIEALTYDPTYFDIPSLSKQMSAIEPLSAPWSTALLFEQAVSAYFDVDSGVFSSFRTTMGAIAAKLVVQTANPEIVLNVTPFTAATTPTIPAAPAQIILTSPATIEVGNVANPNLEMPDSRSHFLLHYLLAHTIPSAPQVPLFSDRAQPARLIDAGCSDSNYP